MSNFEHVVVGNLNSDQVDRWKRYYSDTRRAVEEGVWRRTQDKANKAESNWTSNNDARRRMLQYRYKYDLMTRDSGRQDLVMSEYYLWLHVSLPTQEIDEYHSQLAVALAKGDWMSLGKKSSADAQFPRVEAWEHRGTRLQIHTMLFGEGRHPEDTRKGRFLPHGYQVLEVECFSTGLEPSIELRSRPWEVLATGIRRQDTRGEPAIDCTGESVLPFLPAQVEIGCGPSYEAGVPALDFLHDIYCVTNRLSKQFVFGVRQDRLLELLCADARAGLEVFSTMFRKCFLAKPTRFHSTLEEFARSGYVVGDIITNNFDGLVARSGLTEKFVRRYEETHIIPDIEFHPRAKSLIVVGSHADRRRIQAAARDVGLKVIYIDPEGYQRADGRFDPYPLESPQSEDILIPLGATEAFLKLRKALQVRQHSAVVSG